MGSSLITSVQFRRVVRDYYRRSGRDLPWRRTRDPYRILISEIMLQQTQVSRVEKFYPKFLKRFPTVQALARARLADVLAAWQGLGYNRRALLLKHMAEKVMAYHRGRLPQDPESLADLPGIGRATAGAIAAFAFNKPTPFIETNIRRVYIHFFFPRHRAVRDATLLPLIVRTLDRRNPREWYYALMDYGAMLGSRQRGKQNPSRRSRHYARQPRFTGSERELRGKIITLVLDQKSVSEKMLTTQLHASVERTRKIVASLAAEGFLDYERGKFSIAS